MVARHSILKITLPVNEIVIGMLFPSGADQSYPAGQIKCFPQNYSVAYLIHLDDEMANDGET